MVRLPTRDVPRDASPETYSALARVQNEALRETLASVQKITGVEGVSTGRFWPMQVGALDSIAIRIEADSSERRIAVRQSVITLGYPKVIGAQLLEGREPTPAELEAVVHPPAGAGLALVTEALAKEMSGSAVGQIVVDRRLRYRVVGVLRDFKSERADLPAEKILLLYYPARVVGEVLLLRKATDDSAVDEAVLGTLARIWGPRAPRRLIYMTDVVSGTNSGYEVRMKLLAAFSVVALGLTALAIAGAVHLIVRLRRREIAIRIALGASQGRLHSQVLGSIVFAVFLGCVAGGGLSMVAGRFLIHHLFGVQPIDFPTLVTAIGVIIGVSTLAAYYPALQATRTMPGVVLKES